MAAFAEGVQAMSIAGTRYPRVTPASLREPAATVDANTSRSLAAIITGEIVPRLVLAHSAAFEPVAQTKPALADLDVESFAPLTLAPDARALLLHVDRLLARGVPVDTLMIELLAPAARLLGAWWEEDRCDFVEVTMGLWRLQEVVRELSHRMAPAAPWRTGRRALFASFPGEQHDFGAVMVSELFNRHGWDAEMVVAADMSTLLATVGRGAYDVVGLTVSCDSHSARLPSAILALRSVARNPHMRVLVGGRVLNENPGLAGRAGADGTAIDAREALRIAEELVDALTHEAAA